MRVGKRDSTEEERENGEDLRESRSERAFARFTRFPKSNRVASIPENGPLFPDNERESAHCRNRPAKVRPQAAASFQRPCHQQSSEPTQQLWECASVVRKLPGEKDSRISREAGRLRFCQSAVRACRARTRSSHRGRWVPA